MSDEVRLRIDIWAENKTEAARAAAAIAGAIEHGETHGEGWAVTPQTDDDHLWYCQNCGKEELEDEFFPTDGNPAEHVCPDCGRTDVFRTEVKL